MPDVNRCEPETLSLICSGTEARLQFGYGPAITQKVLYSDVFADSLWMLGLVMWSSSTRMRSS